MKDDYLWDKSGEPATEIERLERQLAGLRFKRTGQPLPLPATPRRFFLAGFNTQALAAAAALACLLLAGGLWLGLRSPHNTADENKLAAAVSTDGLRIVRDFSGPRPPIGPDAPTVVKALRDGDVQPGEMTIATALPARFVRRERLARRHFGPPRPVDQRRAPSPSLQQQELARQQGEQAKAQLIKALHLASDKLNAVQKKIQSNQDRGPIS